MPLESNEAWIHRIKAILVKKNKSGVPRPEEVYDSEDEPSDGEELKAYQTMFGMRVDDIREEGESSTQPPPPTSHEEATPTTSQPIEDQVRDLTMRSDSLWDENQEHHILMSQDMEELRTKMNTVLSNQEFIKQ